MHISTDHSQGSSAQDSELSNLSRTGRKEQDEKEYGEEARIHQLRDSDVEDRALQKPWGYGR